MSDGLSIHIGHNKVDPAGYGGWNGVLAGCLNDAHAMHDIASKLGYAPQLLLDADATSTNVLAALGSAAKRLRAGDILVVTYSGHGGQVADTNGDEDDGLDETWCLYDRQLVDDELAAMWQQFAAGVRILVLSDSCHSGTVTRDAFYQQLATGSVCPPHYRGLGTDGTIRVRAMPSAYRVSAYQAQKQMYDTVQWLSGSQIKRETSATVLLVSGCQDNQTSADGDKNGLFTQTLLEVWANGAFEGGYHAFRDAIAQRMPPTQSPNYLVTGAANAAYEAQKPFTIAVAAAANSARSSERNDATPDDWAANA